MIVIAADHRGQRRLGRGWLGFGRHGLAVGHRSLGPGCAVIATVIPAIIPAIIAALFAALITGLAAILAILALHVLLAIFRCLAIIVARIVVAQHLGLVLAFGLFALRLAQHAGVVLGVLQEALFGHAII